LAPGRGPDNALSYYPQPISDKHGQADEDKHADRNNYFNGFAFEPLKQPKLGPASFMPVEDPASYGILRRGFVL
jgi:hypothetical protein